ncbi:hypothetical protein Hdeb2414_s0036g00730961 [Helianthus debilis subsp. tardiflorus]
MRLSWKKCRLLGIWMTAVVWVSGSNSEDLCCQKRIRRAPRGCGAARRGYSASWWLRRESGLFL